jgi:hypothetical protein
MTITHASTELGAIILFEREAASVAPAQQSAAPKPPRIAVTSLRTVQASAVTGDGGVVIRFRPQFPVCHRKERRP